MITPSFSTSQDDKFVYIRIRVPHVKISDVDVDVDGFNFKFFLKPYFLRLVLPGEVMEDDDAKAQYDVSKGEVLVQLSKVVKQQYFEGLDMLTTLLGKSRKNTQPVVGSALIQVMDSSDNPEGTGETEEAGAAEGEEEEEDDWEVEQELFDESAFELLNLSGPKYGFANQSSGVFARFQGEAMGVVELPEPDATPTSRRHTLRVAGQDRKFDEEHYLADFVSDEEIKSLLKFQPYYNEQYQKYCEFLKSEEQLSKDRASTADTPECLSAATASAQTPAPCSGSAFAAQEQFVKFSQEELDQLKSLPNKEYLLDRPATRWTYLGLVDVILAYAYNHRTTLGDNTVESGWTVAKLSNLLAWFETFTSLKQTVLASARNMLAYPLYRHWKLVKAVVKDTAAIFALGRRQILKCLLQIRNLFLDDDNRYLLNDLYITDYCVWVQRASHDKLKAISEKLLETRLLKQDVDWQLNELEQAACCVQEEHHVVQESCSNGGETDTSSDSEEESSDSSDDDNPDSPSELGEEAMVEESHPESLVTGESHPESLVTGESHPESLLTGESHPESLLTGEPNPTCPQELLLTSSTDGGQSSNKCKIVML